MIRIDLIRCVYLIRPIYIAFSFRENDDLEEGKLLGMNLTSSAVGEACHS